jgi:two-component system, OmpR family, sensor histidine kinase KdpD
MQFIQQIKGRISLQYLIGIGIIVLVAVPCFLLVKYIGYKVVALLLLMGVSLLAMVFDIMPVLVAAFLSALIWNFFFIPPLYKFSIGTTEDILLFLMYFVIAMLNAVLTSKIRKAEQKVRDREERESTIKLYNTLLNSLSHELRTPISAIIGAIDTLKDQNIKLSKANQNELLMEIDIASMRLNRNVENLLSMSRLESGFVKPKPDWCDMVEIINRVIYQNLPQAANKTMQFQPEASLPLFKLDEGFIEMILYNLLHNAVQHTPDGTKISVRLSHLHNSCNISISDNGKGFPEDQMINVFEKFHRIPKSSTGGTGLGLSIVKGFTEAHGGKVMLENLKPSGAIFTITIPAEISYAKDLHHD